MYLAVLHRPGVVRAAPTRRTVPFIRLPSASPSCCDKLAAVAFHHHTIRKRLMAHVGVGPRRGAEVAPGPFPRPALRTGRATLTASGSPHVHANELVQRLCIP